MKRVCLAHVALLFSTLTFSAWNVLADAFEGPGSALLLCAVRDSIAVAILLVAGLLRHKSFRWWLRAPRGWPDWFLLAVVGLSGPCIAPLANVLCVLWAGSDAAGIFNGVSPAAASLLALLLGYELLTPRLVIGLLLGCTGAVIASTGGSSSGPAAGPHGGLPESVALACGAIAGLVVAFSQGLFVAGMRPLLASSISRPPIEATTVITIAYVFAAAASLSLCLGVAAVSSGGFAALGGAWGARQVALSVYAGAVCGALNYALITWANQVLPVTVVALYGAGQPPCTSLVAFLVKGEAITPLGFCSACLVTASICILALGSKTLPVARDCREATSAEFGVQESAPFNPDALT